MDPIEPVFRYLTHPQVRIDAAVPVSKWELSELGKSRAEALARSGWLHRTRYVIASGETKAIQTAEVLAGSLGIEFKVQPAMHENDRSATGFLQPTEFQATANLFFSNPTKSIRGWETAVHAQLRIVKETERALSKVADGGDVLFVGHGAVGTLLYCHYARLAIGRQHDQPPGSGGNYFAVRLRNRQVLHAWRPMELAPD
jgi:broad specificity phosphatase PhoE